MASDRIEVANLALKKLGQRNITSFTQSGSAQAEAINTVWDDLLKEFLSDHHWSFAQKRIALVNTVPADVSRTIQGEIFASQLITAASQNKPLQITSDNHGFVNGDKIVITGVSGMTELNENTYYVRNKTNDTFELEDEDGTAIDGTTGFTAYTSGGQIQKFGNPTAPLTITGATVANPVVITTANAHGLAVNDWVKFVDVQGMTDLNTNFYQVNAVPTTTTFSIKAANEDDDGTATDGTAFSAYTFGGIVLLAPDMVATTNDTIVVYDKPSDYVKLVKSSDSSAIIKVEGNKIISNVTGLKVQYTFLNEDMSQYFPKAIQALATRLASELAFEVTGSVKKARDMLELYANFVLPDAMSVDSQQATPDQIDQDEWLNAQIQGSNFPQTTGETWHPI